MTLQTEPQIIDTSDNLSEHRLSRFEHFQKEIDQQYNIINKASTDYRASTLRLCELLHAARAERIYSVDGYENMTQWVLTRWPSISDSRLSQLLAGGEILYEYDRLQSDLTNVEVCKVLRPENEGQLRTLAAIKPELRWKAYAEAAVLKPEKAPAAEAIKIAHEALIRGREDNKECGEEAVEQPQAPMEVTEERVAHLDADPIPTSRTRTPPQNRIILATCNSLATVQPNGTMLINATGQKGESVQVKIPGEHWQPCASQVTAPAERDTAENELEALFDQ